VVVALSCIRTLRPWKARSPSPQTTGLTQKLATTSPTRGCAAGPGTDSRLRSGTVGEHTREELARRAGVDPDYVDRLVEFGILPDTGDGYSPGDVRRARWVHSLERAGLPLEGMAAAVGDGSLSFSFLDAAAFDPFADVSGETFQELSARTGLPFEILKLSREAVGYAEPRPEDRVREDELSVVPLIEFQLSSGFRPVVIRRWLRVWADSLRRMAETEADAWSTDLESALLESGMTETEMLEAQAVVGSQIAPLLERALLAVYHAQQEHAWTKSAVERVENALEGAGLLNRLHRPPAVSFLDITGYTRLTDERGDAAAADVAETLATLVRRSSRAYDGAPVKWLGDGVMFYFSAPGRCVLSALDMVDGVASQGLPPARVGIHAGPVVFQEGDYFGRTVNLAARITEYARPGEVVVSQEVVDAADGTPVTFTEIGPVELKGVSGTLRLLTARRGN
jgi:adenylate cyclase